MSKPILDETTLEFVIHEINAVKCKDTEDVKKVILIILDKVHKNNMLEIEKKLEI